MTEEDAFTTDMPYGKAMMKVLDARGLSDESRCSLVGLHRCRRTKWLETYGRELTAHNGRDAVKDLVEEFADAVMYASQIVIETGEDKDADMVIGHVMEAYEAVQKGEKR